MTKPKYATAEERKIALSIQARAQMLAQWERQREAAGQDTLGYFGCHRRVRTARGRARDQDCAHCKNSPARHWAHIHNTDPADPQNYLALCQKCHWTYDGVTEKSRKTKGPEGRSQEAITRWSRRTPEQRHAIGMKIAATRKRNLEEQSPSPT
jgi:hypothetical protein